MKSQLIDYDLTKNENKQNDNNSLNLTNKDDSTVNNFREAQFDSVESKIKQNKKFFLYEYCNTGFKIFRNFYIFLIFIYDINTLIQLIYFFIIGGYYIWLHIFIFFIPTILFSLGLIASVIQLDGMKIYGSIVFLIIYGVIDVFIYISQAEKNKEKYDYILELIMYFKIAMAVNIGILLILAPILKIIKK